MTRNSGVGIYGGTFNPIHVGHLRAAEEVAEILGLERVTFVPSARPPHKRASERDPIAAAEERLAWVRSAVADNPRFDVDAIEVERGGASFAIDTLRSISCKTSPALPVFIIGHDAFVELGSWREPEKLLSLAHFAVTTRPPVTRGSLSEWLPAIYRDSIEIAPDGLSGKHRTAGTWVRLIEISRLDISSSDIRARLRAGQSVRYLIPDGAHAAITSSGAYCAPTKNERST
jgi:nicotinate-nucleotide adenylyltransferase